MKIDHNDPRLTAYALGELAESDRLAFETELAGDPEARQEIERIQRAAGILKEKLEAEPCPRLEPAQRNVIYEKVEPAEKATGAGLGLFAWLAGAAALVVVGALMLPALNHSSPRSGTLAVNTAPPPTEEEPSPAVKLKSSAGQELDLAAAQPADAAKPMNTIIVSNGAMIYSGSIAVLDESSARDKDGGILVTAAGSTFGNNLMVNEGAVRLAKKEARTDSGGQLHESLENKVTVLNNSVAYNGTIVVGSGSAAAPVAQAGVNSSGLTLGSGSDQSYNSVTVGSAAGGNNVTMYFGGVGKQVTANGGLVAGQPVGQNGAGGAAGGPVANVGGLRSESVYNLGQIAGNVGQLTVGSSGGGLYANNTPLTKAPSGRIMRGPGYPDDGRLDDNKRTEWNGGSSYVGSGSSNNSFTVLGNTVWNNNNAESYEPVYDNPFYAVTDQPLSTFGLDVDTASYSNIRRFLLNNQLPPRNAVRIEEMLNYFTYDYPAPRGNEPFSLYVEMGECPWNPAHQLALVGLKAKDVTPRQQPPLNLVFLIDISGSMSDANKLPLIKQALHLLVPQLSARDRVSIVVYANTSYVALPSTRGDDHRRILSVIDELNADGGTNGGEGIQHAYAQATENFIKDGINRVILCTDGDFNVGITDPNELTRLIQQKAASGVFLNVFGFGMGNLKDSTMQKLADKGNGQYAYIDDLDEARKALVDQARATLITVAKDVKLQVEFNPAQVQAYRLIGYEKRQLAARDFNNDRKDAGEMGAGHTVTALYEIVPAGEAVGEPGVDALKYQPAKNRPAVNGEWATVKLRYKEPNADKSQLLTAALKNTGLRWRTASDDFQFAAAVATFGMILRDSGYKAESTLDLALELAEAGRGHDVKGYRSEFVDLVKRAGQLAR